MIQKPAAVRAVAPRLEKLVLMVRAIANIGKTWCDRIQRGGLEMKKQLLALEGGNIETLEWAEPDRWEHMKLDLNVNGLRAVMKKIDINTVFVVVPPYVCKKQKYRTDGKYYILKDITPAGTMR